MIILAAISLLFLVSLAVAGLNRYSLRPGYFWFLTTGTALVVWLLIITALPKEPVVIPLMDWARSVLFRTSPGFLLDETSWAYAVAITTLLIAVLLTDSARVWDIQPAAWGADLAIAAAGLLAVFAANPVSLLYGWAVIDLAEVFALLNQLTQEDQRERVVVSFSVRIVGMLLVISGILRAQTMGIPLDFTNIPAEVSGYLILAAGLRLGVLPPHQPFLKEPPLRRGLGTMVRLVPVAASMILLTRVAAKGANPDWELILIISSALALLYGGVGWLFAPNELDGRPFWVFGISSLAVGAAIRGLTLVSLVWGMAAIICGGFLFLYSTRRPRYLWLPALALLTASGLPFTPLWDGLTLFASWDLTFIIVFGLGFILVILGYLRHSFRVIELGDEIESWARILYPVGLAALPLSFHGIAWILGWYRMGPRSVEWWLGSLTGSVIGVIWYLNRRGILRRPRAYEIFRSLYSFGWLYKIFWQVYRATSKLIGYIAALLEGQGGFFWAVLVMILLVVVIVQQVTGG
jgi:hypothetical protein